ncbi:adventurous gliding motility protein AgmC [Archangium primigenium]|uniref:adventurous gliding motility protein AgmC n=1 Tax=[Archangium] primigenium TaxID=2792470 RepID=UPI001957955B|nr:Ig-like domain-containing protein [Archangium primigenium]MBM7119394.1 adhesin [Archangium primigenium]
MKIGLLKKWLAAALCVLLGSTAALAEPDSFGLGSGRDLALSVTASGTVVNSYAPVTAPLATGDTSLTIGTVIGNAAGFKVGDLVMVLQTTGIVPVPGSGGTTPIDLSNDAVGRWEFARLSAVSSSSLTLTAALVNSYAANVTQVIRVPEYTTVTITGPAGRIVPAAWNGGAGGVVAFLATGAVSNAGQINAGSLGFRGGAFLDDDSGNLGCTGLDEAPPSGSQKGEGIANVRFGATFGGRGNVANGGGGGVCYKSGGGGGGNFGAGGLGGLSDAGDGGRNVGGQGGSALTYSLLRRLSLGGGGGAGHSADGTGQAGGRGGGAIFIRASQLTGTGSINASGALASSTSLDAGSGGGAGGSIYLRLVGTAACGSVNVAGGVGGSSNGDQVGPGGGGGGGRVLYQAATGGTCPVTSGGGNPGTQQNSGIPDPSYGAKAGAIGNVTTVTGGLVIPAAPTVTTPANGSFTNNPLPNITGTAAPNTPVVIYIDGVEVGRTTSNGAGNYLLLLSSPLAQGPHTVYAVAEVEAIQSPKSATNTFTVDTTPPAAPVVVAPANGSYVTVVRPPITGTAEPGSTVTVYIDGVAQPTTVTANASGNWTFTPAADLSQGSHTVKATSRDAAGNVSVDSNTNTFILDSIAPPAPVVVAPANGSYVTVVRPPITGTAEANSTVTVYLDGVAQPTTVKADAAGNWTFTPATDLSQGSHTVKARSADAAGNVSVDSNTNTFIVDTIAPPAPVVVAPANGSYVTVVRPAITGTAEANSTVTVYIDGVAQPTTVTANAAGNWTFTPSADLTQGSHTVKATSRDAAGNVSVDSNTNTFIIDSIAPPAPVVVTPANGSYVTTVRPVITGTAEANSTVTVYLDGVAQPTTVTANAAGNWTFTPSADLTQGSHTVKATSRDAAGNVSVDSNTNTFIIDSIAPPAPVVVTPANGSYVTTVRPVITGTAEANSTVTVYIDGAAQPTTVTADASGNWTFTPSADLTQGSHTVKVTSRDAAGNVSVDSNTNTFIIDSIAPPAPVVVAPANGSYVTTTLRPVITGTAEANSRVTVYIDGVAQPTTVTADASGNWSFTPSADLTQGSHTVKATSRDAAGNVSVDSNTNTFIIDTIAPLAPVVVAPADGSYATTPRPVITGTGEPGSTVTVYIDGVAQPDPVMVDASGNWSYTPQTDLTQGSHTVSASATDAAGNPSPASNTNTFTVDSIRPVAPVVVTPANNTYVTTARPVITGTAEANTTVTVYLDGVAQPVTVTADASGNWTFTPATDLTQGSHTVKVTSTDVAGNVSVDSNTNTFIIDSLAPAPPVVTAPANGATESARPTFRGTAEPGATVTVFVDGVAVGTVVADAAGNWSLPLPLGVADLVAGTHDVRASQVDLAGNTSTVSVANTFTVDTSLPTTVIVTKPPVLTNSDKATFTFDAITDWKPVTYECTLDTQPLAICPDTLVLDNLSEGSHTLTVVAVDSRGRKDPSPEVHTWVVDRTPPAAPVVVSPVKDEETSSTPVISGTAEPGSTVTVIIDGTVVGTTVTDAAGNWTFPTTTELTPGAHSVSARATDAAGNTGADSPSTGFTVPGGPTTVVPAPVITSGPEGTTTSRDARFEFGTTQPGVTYECSLDGAPFTACTSPQDYTGLAPGEHTFQVRTRDSAGNVSEPATRTWVVGSPTGDEADVAFLGGGFGCAATGGDASLVLLSLGTLMTLARRRRRS